MKQALLHFLDTRFTHKLVASARGRAFVLAYMADSEQCDEQRVFDMLAQRTIDEPRLHKLVTRHGADEVRHAALLEAELARIGIAAPPIPESLRYVLRFAEHADDLAERFLAGRASVAEMYLFLKVIEERAVREWPRIAEAMRPYDAHAASVIEDIVEDERRHVKYCDAVLAHFAPDPSVIASSERQLRRLEQRAWRDQANAMTRYAVENRLLDVGAVEHSMWSLAMIPPRWSRDANRISR